MQRQHLLFVATVALAACSAPAASNPPKAAPAKAGATATPTEWTPPAAVFAEPEAKPAPEPAMTMPAGCAKKDGGLCTVPAEFAAQLCKKRHPNMALTMFGKGSPWTRAYVRLPNVEAWYVAKARRASPSKLKLYEELIIIADRTEASGGIKVSGFGSYDVVRWDGSCVSVMVDEVSLRSPGTPDVALIPWRKLAPKVRTVLMKDRQIAYRDEQRKKHCRANKLGKPCLRARRDLSRLVAAYVRRGGEVPAVDERHASH